MFGRSGVLGLATGVLVATAASAQPSVTYHAVGDAKGFPGWRAELRRKVDEHGRKRDNSFCVMIGDRGDGEPTLYAILNDRLLYQWEQTNEASIGDDVLAGHVPLDLERDIVRSKRDQLSTYLVTRTWTAQIRAECKRHGRVIHIAKAVR